MFCVVIKYEQYNELPYGDNIYYTENIIEFYNRNLKNCSVLRPGMFVK